MNDKNISGIIPLHTRPVTSVVKMGDAFSLENIKVDIEVDANVARVDNETFVVDTVIICENKSVDFSVMLQIETLVLGFGEMDQISKLVKKQCREEIFGCAEIMILNLTSLHGYPLRIDFRKHIEQIDRENGDI